MKSNGWSAATAALQLFVHLDGEALNVALLMPVKEREQWKDLSNGLSEYYNYSCFPAGGSGESGTVGCLQAQVQELPAGSGMCTRVPGPVVGVDPRSEETPRKVEEGDAQLLWTVREGRQMDDTPLPKGSWVHCQLC